MSTNTTNNRLTELIKNNLYRKRFVIEEKQVINFCSNDYLNLATSKTIKKAFIDGINKYGIGSGSSAQLSGYHSAHKALEEKFAEFLQREKALLFNSGYHANLGVVTALANRNSTVFADKLCHASIIDAIVLSRAKHYRYKHNNHDDITKLLAKKTKNSLLISESVFSIDGAIGAINKIVNIAEQHSLFTIIDDAHGAGVLGSYGRGICEYYGLSENEVDCLVTPLGKSFGSIGAIVSGKTELIEELIQFARTHRYTTSLPPAISLANIEALKIIAKEKWRREKLKSLIHLFTQHAKNCNLPLRSNHITPIKYIMTGNNYSTLQIQKKLLENGYFVACIRHPTVPKNHAGIRISINCMHSTKQIKDLLNLLAEYYEKLCK